MESEHQDEQEEEMGLHHREDYGSLPPPQMHKTAGMMTSVVVRSMRPRYRECLKNHAVGIGGHAVDGCGEFMAAGADGTLDALKCAACGCHRSFHRKETHPPQAQPMPPPHVSLYKLPPPSGRRPPPLLVKERGEEYCCEEDAAENRGGGGLGSCRKRFRTKFTAEQKEKMRGLAERIEWRIKKQDEQIVQRFCEETGVKRQVLKVWLHNNKHNLGKKQQQTQD